MTFFGDVWRQLEEDAIYIGLDLDYFWQLTPKQFNKYMNVHNKKIKEEVQQKDRFNYMLGQYIAFAFNDPKNYPKKPFLENAEEKKGKEMTDIEMEKMARFNTAKKGGKITWT